MSEDSSGAETLASVEEKKPAPKLSEEQWSEARTLCETGVMRASEIARKFGVSASAVSQHFISHGVVYASKKEEVAKAIVSKTAERVAEAAAPFAIARAERIEETKRQHYEYARWISQEMMRVMIEAKKSSAGAHVSSAIGDMKTLRIAAAGLAIMRQERYAILEADQHVNEEELPSIDIRDLTEEEMEHLRNSDADIDLGNIDETSPVEPENEVVEVA